MRGINFYAVIQRISLLRKLSYSIPAIWFGGETFPPAKFRAPHHRREERVASQHFQRLQLSAALSDVHFGQ